jgi:energy-coupling factor transporter transmembrane protein EcfT
MKLVVISLVLGVVVGYLRGGRLWHLSRLKPRYTPLALIGLLLQLVNPPRPWPLVMLVVSFVLLAVFTIANIRLAGFAVILAGLSMNFAVIALNGGMPVSRAAIVASGQGSTLAGLLERPGVKHHLAGPDDRLLFLADVIPVPPPVGQVISVGDLFTFAGVSIVIASAMSRRPRPARVAPVPEVPGVRI